MPKRGGRRGAPKPSLKKLSREEPTKEEEDALIAFVSDGPATATAVLIVSLIERELENLLRRRLRRRDEATMELLTEHDGPMGSFSQKITLGYAFGFYPEIVMENLHIVRRIRNTFAHARKLLEFNHPLIIAELDKVKVPKNRRTKQFKLLNGARLSACSGQTRYFCLCIALTIVLLAHSNTLNRKLHKSRMQRFKTKSRYGYIFGGGGLGIATLTTNALTTLLGSHPDRQSDDPKK